MALGVAYVEAMRYVGVFMKRTTKHLEWGEKAGMPLESNMNHVQTVKPSYAGTLNHGSHGDSLSRACV